MGIKRKKAGPTPTYPEHWQNLAIQPDRQSDAKLEYAVKYPKATLVEAHRAVTAFRNKHR